MRDSHSEEMPGLGWGMVGPKGGPLRGAEKAGCFGAKALMRNFLMTISPEGGI